MNRFTLIAAAGALIFAVGCETEEVADEPVVSLELRSESVFEVGQPGQLRAIGKTAAGEERTVESDVIFTSSNEAVARVDATGAVEMVAGGPVSFTAQTAGLEATLEATVTCRYPNFNPILQFDRVAPKLSWPAKRSDGTDFDFRFEDVHCNADWKETKTLTIVLSAGWCTPCTLYAQRLTREVAQLNELGMEIMIVEVQDKQGLLADLAFAWDHVTNITTGNAPGLVVGDKDTRQGTTPAPGYLEDLPLLTAFPTTLVVRTRDMKVIADSSRDSSYLPLAAIAADPEADWSNAVPVFTNECGPADEEASEPNDVFADATVIAAPGTFPGGICTEEPDMYKVDIAGEWTASVAFEHAVGDLDIFVWDAGRDQPAQDDDGQVVGSATSNDVETFNYAGPAVIAIQGYQRASAPYTLTITAR